MEDEQPAKRQKIDLNDENQPFWPSSPNVDDCDSISSWRQAVVDNLTYELQTTNEILEAMEKFILNGYEREDIMFRKCLLGDRFEYLIERKNSLLHSLLDSGRIPL